MAVTVSRRGDGYDTTGESADWFFPDWPAVAADYDAVLFTVHCYLTTPGNAIPLTHRPGSTVLAGWNPDATFWLRGDRLSVEDDPVQWLRSREGRWHAPWYPHPTAE